MTRNRRYSHEEVALVLRRAGELQADGQIPATLNRVELDQIAAEAGLDMRHMETALAELEAASKIEAKSLGLRLFVLVRREVPGKLTQARMDAAVALMNRSVGVIGEHQRVGSALTWFGRHVAVTLTGNTTRTKSTISIHIEERFHRTTRAELMGVVFGSAFAAPAFIAGPIGWTLGLVPLGLYAMVRGLHRRRIANTEARLERLGDQLAEVLVGDA